MIVLSALLALCSIIIMALLFKISDLKDEIEYQKTLFDAYTKQYEKDRVERAIKFWKDKA